MEIMALSFQYKGSEAFEDVQKKFPDWEQKIKLSREKLYKIMLENNLESPFQALELYLKTPESKAEAILLLAALHSINIEKLK